MRPTERPAAPGGEGVGKAETVRRLRGRWMMNGGVMVVLRAKPKYGGEHDETRDEEGECERRTIGARGTKLVEWKGGRRGWKMIRGCPRIVIYKRRFPRTHPLLPTTERFSARCGPGDSFVYNYYRARH